MKRMSVTLSLLMLFSPACGRLRAQSAPAPQPAGQQHAPDQDGVLFHQQARNVLIDVIATDKHGKPVTSLDKSQFTLTENGKPQTIAFFEEHKPSSESAPEPAPAPRELSPGEYTNIEAIPSCGPLVVLLVDALDSSLTDMAMLRQHLRKYAEQVPPGSQVALFTLTDGLHLVHGFTPDPGLLKAALEKGGKVDLSNRITNLSDRVADQVFATQVALNQFFAASESDFIHQDRRAIVLDALLELSLYLKDLPGRKDLVWFAGDWSWVPLARPAQDRDTDQPQLDTQQLADLFVESRVALYPVDVRGLITLPGFNPGDAGNPSTGSKGGGYLGNQAQGEPDLGDRHLWMNQVAAATGGRAIYDTNGIPQAISRAEAESQHYYTLAYAPANESDKDGFRHVEIRVLSSGIKLQYRTGYYTRNANESLREKHNGTSPLTPAMQFGAPNATQIPFQIKLALAPQQPDLAQPGKRIGVEASKLNSPPIRYVFTWRVDLQHVRLTSGPDGLDHGKLTACLAAFDSNGKLLNHISGDLAFKITPEARTKYRDSGMPITQSFDLPAGHIFIRAALLDIETARTGATGFAYTVSQANTGSAKETQPESIHR